MIRGHLQTRAVENDPSKCYLAFSNGTDNGFWKIWAMYQGMC